MDFKVAKCGFLTKLINSKGNEILNSMSSRKILQFFKTKIIL